MCSLGYGGDRGKSQFGECCSRGSLWPGWWCRASFVVDLESRGPRGPREALGKSGHLQKQPPKLCQAFAEEKGDDAFSDLRDERPGRGAWQ